MGSVYHGRHRGLTGHKPGCSAALDLGAGERDPARDDAGFKELAAAVLKQALLDLGVPLERPGRQRAACLQGPGTEHEDARRWLTSVACRGERTLWLAWLGLTDEEFQAMLAKRKHQGNKNMALPLLGAVA
jgi:hypothetical protein